VAVLRRVARLPCRRRRRRRLGLLHLYLRRAAGGGRVQRLDRRGWTRP
jgi:hypothetical protein